MIARHVFRFSSGQRPKLLWALQGMRKLYVEAREVWCQTNDFRFTYAESNLNRTRAEMDLAEKMLVQRGTVVIGKDIHACTFFSRAPLSFPNLAHLTLVIYSPPGFALAVDALIPQLHRLRSVTVKIQGRDCGAQQQQPYQRGSTATTTEPVTAFFRLFERTRIVLDKMLGREGRCVLVGGLRSQAWRWSPGGEGPNEVFHVVARKKHIKFV
ncbi:hypothetical protein LZ554_001916 [Drepanopeziza brunnea f. sp. 'monogermtubi']|nr:hypothetical protein LZ554_001916 [Drepanopeziza brunnea f. sp. 'monogermtubi']